MIEVQEIKFGVHYMLDGYGADREILKDAEMLKSILYKVPDDMGMHTISEPLVVEVGPKNKKDPGGLSGFVLIAESHISFHTFPERGFVTIDVYTCQDTIDSDKLTALFKDLFGFTSCDERVVDRGTKYPANNIY